MVSRLWKTGTITVLPLSFLTAICTTAKHTSEPTNIGGGAARNDPYKNPIHPGRAGAEAIGERGRRGRSLPASATWRRRRRWRCRRAAWTLRRCSSGHTHTETERSSSSGFWLGRSRGVSATPDAVGERLPWRRWRWPATSGGGAGGEGGGKVENSRSEGIGGWKLFFFLPLVEIGGIRVGIAGWDWQVGSTQHIKRGKFFFPDLREILFSEPF